MVVQCSPLMAMTAGVRLRGLPAARMAAMARSDGLPRCRASDSALRTPRSFQSGRRRCTSVASACACSLEIESIITVTEPAVTGGDDDDEGDDEPSLSLLSVSVFPMSSLLFSCDRLSDRSTDRLSDTSSITHRPDRVGSSRRTCHRATARDWSSWRPLHGPSSGPRSAVA